jgi:hypothetical protein
MKLHELKTLVDGLIDNAGSDADVLFEVASEARSWTYELHSVDWRTNITTGKETSCLVFHHDRKY